MLERGKIKGVLIAWLVAEASLLMATAGMFGWTVVLLTTLFGSVVGSIALVRTGGQLAFGLKDVISRQTVPASGVDQLMRVVASILLIIPGFLTDLVALMLFMPPIRALAIRRLFPPGHRGETGTIDLDRDHWSSL